MISLSREQARRLLSTYHFSESDLSGVVTCNRNFPLASIPRRSQIL